MVFPSNFHRLPYIFLASLGMLGPGGGGIVSECQAGPFFGGKRGNTLIYMLILVHHISTYLSMFQLFIYGMECWRIVTISIHLIGICSIFMVGILLFFFFRHVCKVQVWSWFGNGSKPLIYGGEQHRRSSQLLGLGKVNWPDICMFSWRDYVRSGPQIAAWLLLGIRHCQKSLELVGGLEHLLFFHILGLIIPTNFHIFQRGRYTTNQGRFEVNFDVSIAAQGA